ncbi:PoNe immunity protein domain-containing protein [Janthinobacterium lividum]|uniref:PoNe immunity protein domain-containing protein n=1 Tax=Janthinobacterium lividum TaxID=29581 RepID=UPI0016736720|nr:PoNe immunity protein domain-containing protein [Janthinobacterium lividum]
MKNNSQFSIWHNQRLAQRRAAPAIRKNDGKTMMTTSFDMRRRQQFLYEDLYNKTRVNQFSLINAGIENKKVADSTLENSSVYQFLYLEALWIWMLDYTAGEPIAALAPRIADIVDKFEEWNKVDQFCQQEAALEFPDYGPYEYSGAPDFSILSDYQDTLQLLSITILLRDLHTVKRIVHILRSHRGVDGLFEQLVDGYVEDGQALDTCIIGKPYDTLLQVFYEEDEKATLDLLQKYLKQWYPAMKNHPRWYDGHLRIRDEGNAPYYGYWAFEAGATVFLLDLDDSQIDHLVYPKDLVDYARQLRKEGRYTSLDTEPLMRKGRVEGGQPCPQTGFWETPAKLHSRSHFEQGQIMPVFDDAAYGETIWYWSEE